MGIKLLARPSPPKMRPHSVSLAKVSPDYKTACGIRRRLTKTNFPLLQDLAIYQLTIEPGCFREPHWHPNCEELGYCLTGQGLVTIFSNGNQHDSFVIDEGDMFFVPSGSIHSIENIGDERAEFVVAFSSENPEEFGISGSVGCMSLEVLGNTWSRKAEELGSVTRSLEDVLFSRAASAPPEAPFPATFANRYKLPLESRPPTILNDFGLVKTARKDTWPVLRGLAMYSLYVQGNGMREPHWHPECAEMGYVLRGRSRMTIKDPGKNADTYLLQPGDVYFVPPAYPHHIENLTDEELHFLIFFSNPEVPDIGYTGAIPAFPHRLIEPILNVKGGRIPTPPDLPTDALIVEKINPVS